MAILIIHVLFLLEKNDTLKAHDRIHALQRYSRKYLIRDGTFRSSCFIKMLGQLSRADFNPIRGQRYAEPYLKKLHSMPLHKTRQSIELEVVPYEHLWEMTLDLVQRKK